MVAAVLMPDGKEDWRQDGLGDVCLNCLNEGQVRAAERCRTFVKEIRAWADDLEQLASEVEKMTADDWKTPDEFDAVQEQVQARFRQENKLPDHWPARKSTADLDDDPDYEPPF